MTQQDYADGMILLFTGRPFTAHHEVVEGHCEDADVMQGAGYPPTMQTYVTPVHTLEEVRDGVVYQFRFAFMDPDIGRLLAQMFSRKEALEHVRRAHLKTIRELRTDIKDFEHRMERITKLSVWARLWFVFTGRIR